MSADEEDGSDQGEQSDEQMDSQSDIEDDLGGHRSKPKESDSSDEPVGKKGNNVYKAPKVTAVGFEDKADKKKRQKAEYEKKKIGKSNLIDEL